MILQQSRHCSGPAWETHFKTFTAVESSADDADYFRRSLSRSHRALTCLLLSKATHSLIIKQMNINLENIPPRNSVHPDSQSPKHSGTVKPNSYHLGIWIPMRSSETHMNSYRFVNCSTNRSGGATRFTRTSYTGSWVATPPAVPAPMQLNT